jgi:hypothetical protein
MDKGKVSWENSPFGFLPAPGALLRTTPPYLQDKRSVFVLRRRRQVVSMGCGRS